MIAREDEELLDELLRTREIRRGYSVIIGGYRCCDLCHEAGHADGGGAVVDAKTRMGPWGNLCRGHFLKYGIGLGMGRGQVLITKEA